MASRTAAAGRQLTDGSIFRRLAVLAMLVVALGGCATPLPFPQAGIGQAPAAWQVAERPEDFIGRDVLWGGMILEVRHAERYTELEMLAFPLDRRQQPIAEDADQGRFILIVGGFLEPTQFAPGRFLTFSGRINGVRHAPLRGEPYAWPVLDTVRPYLWPRDFRESSPRYAVGIGVRL